MTVEEPNSWIARCYPYSCPPIWPVRNSIPQHWVLQVEILDIYLWIENALSFAYDPIRVSMH